MRRIVRLTASLCLTLAAASCSGDPDEYPPPPPNEYADRLRACGLLSDRDFRYIFDTSALADCELACLLETPCDVLAELNCSLPLPEIPCLESCYNEPQFDCGDGTLLVLDAVCDIVADCEDGSDEDDCGTVDCGDGWVVVEQGVCDGFAECDNGADEADCPMFACDGGGAIVIRERCDGFDDCADGSDEVGCATIQCPSGG